MTMLRAYLIRLLAGGRPVIMNIGIRGTVEAELPVIQHNARVRRWEPIAPYTVDQLDVMPPQRAGFQALVDWEARPRGRASPAPEHERNAIGGEEPKSHV
jgi:hypothetical protein